MKSGWLPRVLNSASSQLEAEKALKAYIFGSGSSASLLRAAQQAKKVQEQNKVWRSE